MSEKIKTKEGLSVRAVGSNVLIKGTFLHSPIAIQKKEAPKGAYFTWEIASIGKDVDELNVGEFVLLHSEPQVKIFVPENKAALMVAHEGLKRLPDEDYNRIVKDFSKIIVSEYFVVPESYIVCTTIDEHASSITKEMIDLVDYIYDSYKNNPEVPSTKSNLIITR